MATTWSLTSFGGMPAYSSSILRASGEIWASTEYHGAALLLSPTTIWLFATCISFISWAE